MDQLQTDMDCRLYLESIRWCNGIPTCPHCGSISENHYKLKQSGSFKGLYKCQDCRSRFTVTVGTMFEGSHIPLRKWFLAIWIFLSHKKGISSAQLHRDINVTQKTAWYMLSRIRYNLKSHKYTDFDTETQVDETYVGGKTSKKNWNKRLKGTQGRSLKDKTPVFGLISNGMVRAMVVKNSQSRILQPIINILVKPGSTLVSDGLRSYKGLSKNYNHKVINHSEHKYVQDGYHTNSIECFWSHLKRGLNGIYHSASPKHLQSYCDEFVYRFNTRNITDSQRLSLFLSDCIYRLEYRKLIINS